MGYEIAYQRIGFVQDVNAAAQAAALIENRTVILMAAIDNDVLSWRPLLQGMGLSVYNGFHQEGMGDNPVILVSEALWRKTDWPRNASFVRRQSPGGVLCVINSSVYPNRLGSASQAAYWNDARVMLLVAGIDFFTLEDVKDVNDI